MGTPEQTVESWKEKDQEIVVSQPVGFLFDILLRAKVESAPEDVYAILTDPKAVDIFRNIKEATYRRVVEDDGKGRRKLEVGHRGFAKFLFVKITFDTHLYVWEDDNTMTVRFQNARDGFMKKFDGSWHVQPFTQDTLDEAYHQEHKHTPWQGAAMALAAIQKRLHIGPHATQSLVTLEQAVAPKALPPSAIQSIIRGLCARQVQSMMEDLRKEAGRRGDLRQAGQPVLSHAEWLREQERLARAEQEKERGWFAGSGSAAPMASLSSAALQLDMFRDCCCPLEVTVRL